MRGTQVDISLHLSILESPDRKLGMIGIRSLFTNEGNLLFGSAALMTLAILKILCRKVAVLIQCLAVCQDKTIAFMRL